jgi:hypothetical protein
VAGWAWHKHDDPGNVNGPYSTERPVPFAVTSTDMPAAKPVIPPRRRIKGVPAVTETHEDYMPGQGTWRPV